MSRLGVSIAALTLSLLAMTGQAHAWAEDKDVAKLTSFGGMCANCDL
ncbi:MAG: pentapeptide repeat-containing protein, partial [Caulobacter sp.]